MKKSKSFRKRMHSANFILIICILIFLFVFNSINSNVLRKYNDLLQAYNLMLEYYGNMEEASTHIKDYLYTDSEQAMQKYETSYNQASNCLKSLEKKTYIQESWRFSLLENMSKKYDQLCHKIARDFDNDKPDYEENYNTLQQYYRLIFNTSSDYYQMITKSMQSEEVRLSQLKTLTTGFSFLLVLILSIWVLYFMYHIMNSLSKPLDLLLHNINKVKEGKYDLRLISDSGQEMEELCLALNDMADQIQKNFDAERQKANLEKRLLAQENESLRKDELLIQSELQMLQNQINPHFLFNTLNMINRLVEIGETQTASDMILKTSQLLRYGLDMQNKISDLRKELEAIRAYIDIQKLRLGDRIDFIVHVEHEDEINDIRIPGMILQPLVENSLKHGLSNVMQDGEVEIFITKEDQVITISVSDNGEGMSQDKLNEFIKNSYQKDDGKNHLGLYNVVKRLEMFYREHIEIQIESDIDCGFSFTARINTANL